MEPRVPYQIVRINGSNGVHSVETIQSEKLLRQNIVELYKAQIKVYQADPTTKNYNLNSAELKKVIRGLQADPLKVLINTAKECGKQLLEGKKDVWSIVEVFQGSVL